VDKNTKLRLVVTIAVLGVSLWYLWPSIRFYSHSKADRVALQENQPVEYNKLKDRALKLGLDLQGGMHLVLELDREKIHIPEKDVKDAIDRTLEIIRNRVDQFGVAEPLIQRVGGDRIIVELPGMEDEERAKELVKSSAFLEFKVVKHVDQMAAIVKKIDDYLLSEEGEAGKGTPAQGAEGKKGGSITGKADDDTSSASIEELLFPGGKKEKQAEEGKAGEKSRPVTLSSLMSSFPIQGGSPDVAVLNENVAAVEKILARKDVSAFIPKDVQFQWGEKIFTPDGREFRQLFLLDRKAQMTGDMLATASATVGTGNNPRIANQPIVNLRMTDSGADVFERVTGRNVGERMAIVLDGVVKSAPVIRQRISGGQAQIEGIDSIEEARDLSIILRAGALPAPIKIIEERTVGPSLGSDSIQKSKVAGIIGMVVVVVFVLFYYRFAGLLASIALFMDVILVMAALAGLRATLTLPGIAGLILTIGMAVDANVLIYERIREELATGKSIRASVDVGYERAFITILDANITTFLTAVVLLRFGTGPVKGFAVTLSIGIIASVFTAVYVTRAFFNLYLGKRRVKSLSI